MKLIYVASPYAGDVENNVEFAKRACRYVMEQGHAFFAPHLLYPQILEDSNPAERETGLKLGHHMLERCDEMWVFGNRISSGMEAEIERAKQLGIPIRYVSAEQILGSPNPTYAIWVKGRPDSPLAGKAGFLSENRQLLTFTSQQKAMFRIGEIRGLCLNSQPVTEYRCMEYPQKYASDSRISLESLREPDTIPAFDPNKFEVRSREYGNTGGHCMVASVEFYLPDLNRTLWVNCNDECVTVTSADFIWQDEDKNGGWHDYEAVRLYDAFYQQTLPEDVEPWLPMIQKALEYTIEQETEYLRGQAFSLPVAWLPKSIWQKTAPEYLAWLQAEGKEIRIAKDGRIEIDEAYPQSGQSIPGMTGLQ
ncbi:MULTISPECIES: DUF4406 domain-containing protein [unclassified Dehalobacter]|uniref:DUF7768 domain-containing protein n=1 Tax=unclassified Dehalobacter TaxID=2635733 RepID=UPI000E6D581C|nr:hypothetical protein A7K50_12730 [Dehalobacter sp. MCB1]TCX47391.1 hypothetical protein C1I36_13890 [Dehalobacter sp. 14DCB1]TCX55604.1 hypothetical protein C1I38_02855 [Dehalobacter sp. 12DCB1]